MVNYSVRRKGYIVLKQSKRLISKYLWAKYYSTMLRPCSAQAKILPSSNATHSVINRKKDPKNVYEYINVLKSLCMKSEGQSWAIWKFESKCFSKLLLMASELSIIVKLWLYFIIF